MKIREHFKKKKYLVQLILTIAGFVCIPLILSQMLIIERSTQEYANLNEQSIREKLYSNFSYFKEEMSGLSYTAAKVSQDQTIRAVAKGTANEYEVYLAANRIDEYSDGLWKAGVWFYESGHVLHNNVNLSLNQFCNRIAGESTICSTALQQFFQETESLEVFSTVKYSDIAQDVIIIAKPVSFRSALEKDATVFFVAQHNELEQNFSEVFRNKVGVALIDPESNFLIQSESFSGEWYSDASFHKFLAEDSQNHCVVHIDGKNFKVYKYRDAASEYFYLVSIDEDDIGVQLRKHINSIQLVMVVSSILMIVLLVLIWNICLNYQLIHGQQRVV